MCHGQGMIKVLIQRLFIIVKIQTFRAAIDENWKRFCFHVSVQVIDTRK